MSFTRVTISHNFNSLASSIVANIFSSHCSNLFKQQTNSTASPNLNPPNLSLNSFNLTRTSACTTPQSPRASFTISSTKRFPLGSGLLQSPSTRATRESNSLNKSALERPDALSSLFSFSLAVPRKNPRTREAQRSCSMCCANHRTQEESCHVVGSVVCRKWERLR
ncbi:hypothetical protein V8G54_004715 [Vigna mungo]|uniref:Uncharacterized protein n=1 Tax=Vigna mungo TaxID=3915 RepID=A0AAQ3PC81_VIGMU